jgi:tetratricopeptide (TPR) repeat protein
MRRLNLVFVAILLAAVALFGAGMHLVHGVQVWRNASALLDRARRAEADKDLEKAGQLLSQYLNLRREDGSAWEWYARLTELLDPDRRRLERVFLVHEEALRYNRGDRKLERRCADLALELRRYKDAQRHLTNLLEEGQPAFAERAELEDLLGQCDQGLARYEDAEKWYLQAIAHDPWRVSCYDRLARLRRDELRRNAAADCTIEEMIAKNPKAGIAYTYRWRYVQSFAPPADANDIQKALELAPGNLEVLFTAAVASEAKRDAAAARGYYEQGFTLDPKNAPFALNLARLETREGHLDRAEAVLRRGFQARPWIALVFVLAENLIKQGKINGKDEARDYIGLLQNAGLGETLVRFLEAEILFQQKKWAEAIVSIGMARAVLASERQLTSQLNLMLAECYNRMGDDDARLDALRQAAEGNLDTGSACIELAQALARSGKLDEAVVILLPLVEHKPEWRLDLVRLLLQRATRQPREQRNWPEVEQFLHEAEKAFPPSVEELTILRLDLLAAQSRMDDARALLTAALGKAPKNRRYWLSLARLTQRERQDKGLQQAEAPVGPTKSPALRIIDQVEQDLGPHLDVQLARLDYWDMEGGDAARAAVAKLADTRKRIPAADQPAFLDHLSLVETRLGALDPAREHGRELAALEPDNLGIRLRLFDLAMAAGDHANAADLVDEIHKAEGDRETSWRFAWAVLLIDKVRRGAPEHLAEAQRLASEISKRRPKWSSGFALNGELAELAGSTDQAITAYVRAVELGNIQPSLVRHLVVLLNERERFEEIDHIAQLLRDQGAALGEITIVRALDAIRKGDFDRGIAFGRQVFPASSTNAGDHLNLGRIYTAAGRSDEAGQEFRRAVELGRGVPDNWLAYVQHLARANQFDQARAVVEAARQALPADLANLTLARCALLLGDTGQAEALIGKVMDQEGKAEDLSALRLAATVSLSRNRPDQVEKYLERLDRSASASPADKAWANRMRTTLLLSKGRPTDHDRALALVEHNLANAPDSVEDQILKATILALRPGREAEATAILKRLAGANRLGVNERFLLAQLYIGQHEEQKYQDEMRKLVDLKPRNPKHLVHYVNYWIDRNQLDQADRWLAELKQADPQGLPALELESRMLDLRNRRPELLALLESHSRDVPNDIGTVANLLNRFGFANEAEEAYKAFAAHNASQPERSLALAQFLGRQDRVRDAMDILKKAWSTCRPEQVAAAALVVFDAPSAGKAEKRQIEAWVAAAVQKRPNATILASKLGVIRVHQGQFGEAEALFRRVLTSDPDNTDALNNLAWLLALRDRGKAQEALELINHAIVVQGAVPFLVDTRAVVLIRAGQLDRALFDLDRARTMAPRKPSLALHLAWAYQAKGKTNEARRAFQQAKDLGWKLASSDPLERSLIKQWGRELTSEAGLKK